MLKKWQNIVLVLLILFFGLSIYYADKELFYYGRHQVFTYDLLPMCVKPELLADSYGGFHLWQENENGYLFDFITPNDKYIVDESTTETTDTIRILKYFYNDTLIVAEIFTNKENRYYIEARNARIIDDNGDIVKTVYKNYNLKGLKKVDLRADEKKERALSLMRSYSMLLLLITLTLLVYRMVWRDKGVNYKQLLLFRKADLNKILPIINSVFIFAGINSVLLGAILFVNHHIPEPRRNIITIISILFLFAQIFYTMYLTRYAYAYLKEKSKKTNIVLLSFFLLCIVFYPIILGIVIMSFILAAGFVLG